MTAMFATTGSCVVSTSRPKRRRVARRRSWARVRRVIRPLFCCARPARGAWTAPAFDVHAGEKSASRTGRPVCSCSTTFLTPTRPLPACAVGTTSIAAAIHGKVSFGARESLVRAENPAGVARRARRRESARARVEEVRAAQRAKAASRARVSSRRSTAPRGDTEARRERLRGDVCAVTPLSVTRRRSPRTPSPRRASRAGSRPGGCARRPCRSPSSPDASRGSRPPRDPFACGRGDRNLV